MMEGVEPRGVRHSVAAMHAVTCQAAGELVRQAAELASVETLIDVGGGSGGFLIGLARALPRLHGAILDLPELQAVADAYLRESGAGGRARFHPGDFRRDPLPPGADAYSVLLPLQDRDPGAGDRLLEKIACAAPLGGLLILGDFLLRSDPQESARVTQSRWIEAEYGGWLAEFGFTAEQSYATSAGMHFLIARRLPVAVVEGGQQREVDPAELEEEESLAEAA